MKTDTDPNLKFFFLLGKIKLKTILKKVKTNVTIQAIPVKYYIIK